MLDRLAVDSEDLIVRERKLKQKQDREGIRSRRKARARETTLPQERNKCRMYAEHDFLKIVANNVRHEPNCLIKKKNILNTYVIDLALHSLKKFEKYHVKLFIIVFT